MIKFDEEIKSYKKSLEIGESADAIYNQDFTDMADVVLGIMKDDKKSAKKPKRLLSQKRKPKKRNSWLLKTNARHAAKKL